MRRCFLCVALAIIAALCATSLAPSAFAGDGQTRFLVPFVPGGTIGGTVYSLDTFTQVPGVPVTVSQGGVVVESAVTNASGSFFFTLSPGSYVLDVQGATPISFTIANGMERGVIVFI